MTKRAASLPRDVALPHEYLTLPPRFSLPEHEAVAFAIWLDLQRRGEALGAGADALGVSASDWRELARVVAHQLDRRVTVTVPPTAPAAALWDWPSTPRERLLKHAIDSTNEEATKPLAIVRRAAERLSKDDPRSTRNAFIETADRLYVEHGINAVGVSLIVESVPSVRATLYKHFGSVQNLMADVLAGRHQLAVDLVAEIDGRELSGREALAQAVRHLSHPPGADLLLHAVQLFREDDHPGRVIALAHRDWRLSTLRRLLDEAQAVDPVAAAAELAAALDGASVMLQAGDTARAERALSRALDAVL